MNKKRLISLGLSGILMLSMVGCGDKDIQSNSSETQEVQSTTQVETSEVVESATDQLDWLNTDSTFPVVNEGTEKTLSIYVQSNAAAGKPEESYAYQFLTDQTNVNLEITTFYSDNRNEFLSLAFASGELPDLIIGASFTAEELIRYGASEGQLLDLAPYINETYMPNLLNVFETYPDIKQVYFDQEGHVWSLGQIANLKERGNIAKAFLNYEYLDELNLEVPTTLDGFVDTMQKIKDAGLTKYPVGGSYTAYDPSDYILNALGYVGARSDTGRMCLRDGVPVLPYADRAAFGEYLKVMNHMYENGLIHPDFYTMDATTTKAALTEGAAFFNNAAYLIWPDPEDYNDFWTAIPLTSDLNDTAQWYNNTACRVGGAVVTSACEEPELAARFLDCFYDMEEELYYLLWSGPNALLNKDDETADKIPEEILYGLEPMKKDGKWNYKEYWDHQADFASTTEFVWKNVALWGSGVLGIDSRGFDPTSLSYYGEPDWFSFKTQDELRAAVVDYNNGERSWRVPLQVEMAPYVAEEQWPGTVYLDADTSNSLANTKTAMDEYAKQEIAKFVTGARAITDDELDNYFKTLEGLGYADYVKVYADYYEAIK